ncbi:MAG: ATP-binding protein, partial [Candidatus Anstonellaceae archaeon]
MNEKEPKDLKINTEFSAEYNAEHIEILEGLEGVRKRPAMYIGDIGSRGLHHLVFEVVDNSIDEALAGYCKEIKVTIFENNSVCVEDDGRGIPVEKHKIGKSALEVVMTMLHAGGKFSNKIYKVSGGLHGVGVSVVNALSEWCEVKVKRNKKIYFQRYVQGKAVGPVEEIGESTSSGTSVTFLADKTIFGAIDFDYKIIAKRLEELAYLNKGIRIILEDKRENKSEVFHYSGGIIEYLTNITKSKKPLHPIIYINKQKENVSLEACIQYCQDYSENILTYVNSINTMDGGTHLIGFRTALTRAIVNYIKNNKLFKEEEEMPNGEDVKEGLYVILSIKIPNPSFEGQTKTRLANLNVKGIVDSVIFDELKAYFEEHPSEANIICQKVVLALQARLAAQKSKELVRRKGALEGGVLPGKLADCSEQDPSICELFIVEGDSAGGSAKQARNRRTQAVLPLRGKIL